MKWMALVGLGLLLLSGCRATPAPAILAPTLALPPDPAPVNPPLQKTSPGLTFTPPVPTVTLSALATLPAPTPTPQITPTPPFQKATVLAEKLDLWDDPANEKSYWHRQTQLITGEKVLILAEKDAWAQVIAVEQPSAKDERGYPGWVRKTGLAGGWSDAPLQVVVMERTALAYEKPEKGARLLMRLYEDARLALVEETAGWVAVSLPDGRKAWLAADKVRLLKADEGQAAAADLLRQARTLASAPYLWGGTTSDSPDCSGFIYRLFHSFGILMPRDADDQEKFIAELVPKDQIRPGDLIFFSDKAGGPVTHVGLALEKGEIMDANPWLGLTIHPLQEMNKYYVYFSTRRVLTQK